MAPPTPDRSVTSRPEYVTSRPAYLQVSDVVHDSPAFDGEALRGDVVVVDLQVTMIGISERAVADPARAVKGKCHRDLVTWCLVTHL